MREVVYQHQQAAYILVLPVSERITRGFISKQMRYVKAKGRRLEHMVANTFLSNGIASERTPLSGALGGNYGEDVIVGTRDQPIASIECKNREGWSNNLWKYLERNDILAIKKNKRPVLVFMELDTFIQLVRK
jgi:hypothetical protein